MRKTAIGFFLVLLSVQLLSATVLVNHVGYLAGKAKTVVVKSDFQSSTPAITDDLNDWSLVHSRTANLTFDKNYPENFEGDVSRVLRSTSTKEEIVYRLDSLKGFEADIYFWPSETVTHCSLFVSANGSVWQAASPLISGGSGVWLKFVYTLSNLSGVQFVKIRFNNISGVAWSPNISKVKLTSWTIDTTTPKTFHLQSSSMDTVFTAPLITAGTDLGLYLQGDFTNFEESGRYRVLAGTQVSRWFYIGDSAKISYQNAIWKLAYNYPRKQRCGNTTINYRGATCHLDDGKRTDNGQHHDASGGWHDACDLRKWMHATQSMMFGLFAVRKYGPVWDSTNALIDELKWGSAYFRKMQDTAGYLYDYCGGDDGNYWSDNIIGTGDDRPLQVNRAASIVHYQFIAHQAMLSRLTRNSDTVYSAQSLAAALGCYRYSLSTWGVPGNINSGSASMAGLSLFRATLDSQYLDFATACADSLALLQETGYVGNQSEVKGYFYSNSSKTSMATMIYIEPLNLISLCELLEFAPNHPNASKWGALLQSYCNDYLSVMASKNAFGLVPYSLYKSVIAGNRQMGSYYYRYFMPFANESAWWVGINSNILGNAIVLYKTGKLLNRPEFKAIAVRQLDWVLGANPFDASSVTGVGYNPIPFYIATAFSPATPLIDGGVMNGIGGTVNDQPDLKPGSWQTAEYWTPHISHMEWLLSEMLSDTTGSGNTVQEMFNVKVPFKAGVNAFPNPFNPITKICFSQLGERAAQYIITDMRGRQIRNYTLSATKNNVQWIEWDGNDAVGRAVAGGVYIGRLVSRNLTVASHKLVLSR